MPARHVHKQKQFREVRDPGFCYLCGVPWRPSDERDDDHVPPKCLFAEADRTPPLLMRTHVRCNNGHSTYDQQIGQLVSLLWKDDPRPKDVSALRVSLHEPEGGAPFAAVEGLSLRLIFARWVKAFHAALYGEYLRSFDGWIFEPFPGGDLPGEDTTLHVSHPAIVREIKKNRTARNLDRITAFNGQCRYECVWTHLDNGWPVCMFALDLYAWHRLGDVGAFPARSCVGLYRATDKTPRGAARATRLHFPITNAQPLNAFEE